MTVQKEQKSDKKYGKEKHVHIFRLWREHVQSSQKD